MRFFKLVMNFVLLACVASIAGTASASSACNMRDGSGLFTKSNPDTPRKQVPSKAHQVVRKGQKGKR